MPDQQQGQTEQTGLTGTGQQAVPQKLDGITPKGTHPPDQPPKQSTSPESSQSDPKEDPAKDLKEAQKKLFLKDKKPAEEPLPETFTKIDASTLSPELKAVHDSMLADYKRAVQKVSDQKGHVTEQDRNQILSKALDNLTDQEFEAATQHPMFVNKLMNYLNRTGAAPQPQQQQTGDISEQDLEYADPLTKKLYEQNQELMNTIKDLKGRVDNTDVATRNAAIQAEDARLQSKYQNLYNPNAINQFLGDLQSGRAQLTRELLFKAMDYDNAVQRWYDWGKEESYEEHPNKGDSSMLSNIQPGGKESGYEVIKQEKGENRHSFWQRLVENSKQRVANGERSPYMRTS